MKHTHSLEEKYYHLGCRGCQSDLSSIEEALIKEYPDLGKETQKNLQHLNSALKGLN